MKNIFFALILGCGIVFQYQSVYAQVDDVDSDNTLATQTVDKKILANEELMKNILLNPELMKTITPEQLEEYISKGADVNALGKYGETPLMVAAGYNHIPQTIEVLLKYGANINAKDENGLTPLMCLLFYNELPENQKYVMMKIMLKFGAEVNIKSEKEQLTPLMFAILTNDTISINLLLEFGADVNIKGKKGVTALMLATTRNQQKEKMLLGFFINKDFEISHLNAAEIVQVLIANGADVNAKFDGELPILSVAAGSTDNPKVIQILLDNGAKIEDGNKLLDLLDKNEYIEKNQDYWDLRDRIYNEMNN